MKKIFLYSFLFLTIGVQAQKKNYFQLELFGKGLFNSINYERVLSQSEKGKTVASLGIGYMHVTNDFDIVNAPLYFGKIFQNGKHGIELGGGITYSYYSNRYLYLDFGSIQNSREGFNSSHSIYLNFNLGYRYNIAENVYLKASFSPLIGLVAFHPNYVNSLNSPAQKLYRESFPDINTNNDNILPNFGVAVGFIVF